MNLLDMYDSKNYAHDLIKQSIKNMKYENNQSRYMFIDKLLDYYQGDDTAKYIKRFFKATAFQEIPLMSYNVTKRMIDKMSRIYTLGASRTLSEKNDEYQSLNLIVMMTLISFGCQLLMQELFGVEMKQLLKCEPFHVNQNHGRLFSLIDFHFASLMQIK